MPGFSKNKYTPSKDGQLATEFLGYTLLLHIGHKQLIHSNNYKHLIQQMDVNHD